MTDIKRYSICESCGTTNITRERRPNGDDSCLICLKKWPSKETKILIPEQEYIKAVEKVEAQAKEIERLQNLNRATWDMYKHAKSLLSETQLLQLERLFKNDEAAE